MSLVASKFLESEGTQYHPIHFYADSFIRNGY